MKIETDWGPEWPEETMIKHQLALLQQEYMKEAKPLIDRLAAIRACKMPKIIVWKDELGQ